MPEKTLIIVPTKPPSCPYCGRVNHCLSGPAKPREGDLAVCVSCKETSMIEVDPVRLRKPKGKVEEALCRDALGQVLGAS